MHVSEGIQRINILGEVNGDIERELLAILGKVASVPMEISFYDSQLVTSNTILALKRLCGLNDKVQMIVYHPVLAGYLHKLGFTFRHKSMVRKRSTQSKSIQALALGGSADSLEKIIKIIERLPNSDVVVFVVQHVPRDKPNKLDEILRTRTDYTLFMPHHMTPIKPGSIYIAPPGYHMRVHDGHVYLTRDRKHQFAQPSIGILFDSLAREYGETLIAALLCEYGWDGVEEMELIQQRKGLSLVERSDECKAAELVENAAARETLDRIVSWREIASFFAAAVQPKVPPDDGLITLFLEAVEARYGYAFHTYSKGMLQRRITKLMKEIGDDSFYTFQQDVLTQPLCFERLFLEFTIGVTEFFRDPLQMAYLRDHVLPYLHSFPHIRIWVAGCASGETVYSLAILLEEAQLLDKVQIYATDINPVFLQQARNGMYGIENLKSIREKYLLSGCAKTFDYYIENHGPFFSIARHFQKKILFYHHSLENGGVFNEFQLILCSNVIIYFNEILQMKLMELFSKSLHQDGYLILGAQESIHTGHGERFFQVENEKMKSYRWKQG